MHCFLVLWYLSLFRYPTFFPAFLFYRSYAPFLHIALFFTDVLSVLPNLFPALPERVFCVALTIPSFSHHIHLNIETAEQEKLVFELAWSSRTLRFLTVKEGQDTELYNKNYWKHFVLIKSPGEINETIILLLLHVFKTWIKCFLMTRYLLKISNKYSRLTSKFVFFLPIFFFIL